MPSNLSPRAKTTVAAVTATVMAGVTAYEAVTAGGHWTWWDLVPVLAAVFGVATTDHVDNTISSPAAKAWVHGALSALAAITAGIATVVGSEPHGVSLAKLAVAALGSLAVWAYPEAAPVVKTIEGEVDKGAPAPQVLTAAVEGAALLVGDRALGMTATQPPAAGTPRQVDGVPNSAWSLKPVAAGTTSAPVDSGPATAPMPTVTPTVTPAPAPAPAVAPVPTA